MVGRSRYERCAQFARALLIRDESCRGTNPSFKREFAHHERIFQMNNRDLACCCKERERDGQIEPRPRLAQRARCKIYDDLIAWHTKACRFDSCPHALSRFLDCSIGHTYDRERRDAARDEHLDFDRQRFNTTQHRTLHLVGLLRHRCLTSTQRRSDDGAGKRDPLQAQELR